MLFEVNQGKHKRTETVGNHSCELPTIVKFTETKAGGWFPGGCRLFNIYKASLWEDERVLEK